MEKIRLGLIGCGGMMRAHASGIQEVEGVEITAVCDIERERAEKVAEVLDSPYVTTDYTTMVDHVDAVLVVLPHHLHYTCGLFFARHKKHILMEKPLCNTEEECLRLIKACEDEGVVLMCAYPVRYWTGIIKLKELMDSGEYGKPFMMSVWTEQLTQLDELAWGASGCLGGGQLFSHGCHYIDLLLWFLGKPVSGTHFGTNLGTPWMLREGTSAATIKFESGAIGYHGATWGARGSMLRYDFQIQMEKGMLEYQHNDGVIRLYDRETMHQPAVEEGAPQYKILWKREDGQAGKQTQHEMNHFLDCVRTGKKPITDGYSSLQGLRVIWKMYNAEKNGFVADLRDCALPE
ncbi:MAG: Gfo/Idh/MocA family oxidoreductase [Clostridia bacterium]|nr:Gfo/Idh/MocA family oxidoreductase [Oscillospiraceae bacterium]MBR6748380.1 Gfo/Idh/MocA family oxidoreductase [Clostridia bacterium]